MVADADQSHIEEAAAAQCETQGVLGEGEPYCNEHSVVEVVVGAQNVRFPLVVERTILAWSGWEGREEGNHHVVEEGVEVLNEAVEAELVVYCFGMQTLVEVDAAMDAAVEVHDALDVEVDVEVHCCPEGGL